METPTTQDKYGLLFAGEPVSESEKTRVMDEIHKIGGALTFVLTVGSEGWVAQCNEVPAIIAGSTNPDPKEIEITSEIRAAIFAAFDVKRETVDVQSPYQGFKYSIIEE